MKIIKITASSIPRREVRGISGYDIKAAKSKKIQLNSSVKSSGWAKKNIMPPNIRSESRALRTDIENL